MKRGIVAIFDTEKDYANKLMEYITDKNGMPFITIAFTGEEELFHYLELNSIDILLVSVEMMKERIKEVGIEKIVLLSSGEVLEDYPMVYKYQSSESIVRELLNLYSSIYKEQGKINIHLGRTEIVSIYSPAGRVGKTVFALTLGQILSADFQTLYINMETFSAFEQLFQTEYSADLSDLMYYFKQYPESLHIKLKAVVMRLNRLDYIPPMIYPENLREVCADEWMELISNIVSFGLYEKIIIDVGNIIGEPFKILENSNSIYMPTIMDDMVQKKEQVFFQCLKGSERTELMNKIVKFEMPDWLNAKTEPDYFGEYLWGRLGERIRTEIVGRECV